MRLIYEINTCMNPFLGLHTYATQKPAKFLLLYICLTQVSHSDQCRFSYIQLVPVTFTSPLFSAKGYANDELIVFHNSRLATAVFKGYPTFNDIYKTGHANMAGCVIGMAIAYWVYDFQKNGGDPKTLQVI